MTAQMDQAAKHHDTRRIYQTMKKMGLAHDGWTDRRGATEIDVEQGRDFLHNRGAQPGEVDESKVEAMSQDVTDETLGWRPSYHELLTALTQMKETAPGPDEITRNMLLHGGPELQHAVIACLQQLWDTPRDQWPTSLHRIEAVMLHKKGDRSKAQNYRYIMLIQIALRILGKVIAKRLSSHAETNDRLRPTQFGFRAARSVLDPILIMSVALELTQAPPANPDPLTIVLADLAQAYPSTVRRQCYRTLSKLGVPNRLIDIIKDLNHLAVYHVRNNMGISTTTQTLRGLKEGAPEAPVIFNLYHSAIMTDYEQRTSNNPDMQAHFATRPELARKRYYTKRRVNLPQSTHTIPTLLFADDTNLLTRASVRAQAEQILESTFTDWGMTAHPEKYERLGIDNHSPAEKPVRFLGAQRGGPWSYKADEHKRLERARQAWSKLARRLPEWGLPDKCRGQIARACIMSIYAFGCECRTTNKRALHKAETFWNRVVRGAANQRIRNMKHTYTMSDLRKRLGVPTIYEEITARQLNWLGQLIQRPQHDLARQALSWTLIPECDLPSRRGKSNRTNSIRLTYYHTLLDCQPSMANDTKLATFCEDWPYNWETLASNKSLWKRLVRKRRREIHDQDLDDTWKNRHREPAPTTQRPPELNGLAPANRYTCPHCQDDILASHFKTHLDHCIHLTVDERRLSTYRREARAKDYARRREIEEQQRIAMGISAAPKRRDDATNIEYAQKASAPTNVSKAKTTISALHKQSQQITQQLIASRGTAWTAAPPAPPPPQPDIDFDFEAAFAEFFQDPEQPMANNHDDIFPDSHPDAQSSQPNHPPHNAPEPTLDDLFAGILDDLAAEPPPPIYHVAPTADLCLARPTITDHTFSYQRSRGAGTATWSAQTPPTRQSYPNAKRWMDQFVALNPPNPTYAQRGCHNQDPPCKVCAKCHRCTLGACFGGNYMGWGCSICGLCPRCRTTGNDDLYETYTTLHTAALPTANIKHLINLPAPPRPAGLPPTQCEFCQKHISKRFHDHRRTCEAMPYKMWLSRIRFLHSEPEQSIHRCQYCGTRFASLIATRAHESACKRRAKNTDTQISLGNRIVTTLTDAQLPDDYSL